MYYDVTVIENPVYEVIMRLPLNIICFVASSWQVTRCTILWCDTNGNCCLQKDLVEAVTVSDTACYISGVSIKFPIGGPKFRLNRVTSQINFMRSAEGTIILKWPGGMPGKILQNYA